MRIPLPCKMGNFAESNVMTVENMFLEVISYYL